MSDDGANKGGKPSERGSILTVLIAAVVAFVELLTRRSRRRHRLEETEPAFPPDKEGVSAYDAVAAGATSGPKGWLLGRARARGWGWLGRGLQVHQRYAELRGGDMAAAVTLQAFLSLFPLAVVGIAILGYLQAGSENFADDVIDYLGLTGEGADIITTALDKAAQSRRVATVVGLVGLLWSGLGFTSALRLSYNQAWQVQDRGWRDRGVGLLWFVGAGAMFFIGVSISAALGFVSGPLWPFVIAVGLVVNFALFLWTSAVLANVRVGLRPLLPGAVLGAIGLEALTIAGAFVVPRMIARASALWGTLGVVFAILVWLLLFGRLVVYTAVLNVVLYEADVGTVYAVVEVPRHPGATRAVTRGGSSRPEVPGADSAPFGQRE